MKILLRLSLVLCLIGSINYSMVGGSLLVFDVYAADCVASNNLSETARSYISRCRKGSINSVFPGEMYSKTLGEIKSGRSAVHKKAWKLLNDSRFAK